MAIGTDGSNYDSSKGEQMALNVDGIGGNMGGSSAKLKAAQAAVDIEDRTFPSGLMDKQVLTSSRVMRDTSRYAVGILDKNELHVTAVRAVLQLRPDMKYLAKSDKTAK